MLLSLPAGRAAALSLMAALLVAGCAGRGGSVSTAPTGLRPSAPSPDPRVGLKAGRTDAAEAFWNMKLLSATPSPERFAGVTNSDLAFLGPYAIQGNYNGWQIWDISTPTAPKLATAYFCPASQSDVSVYRNLLFISGEGLTGRLDCGGEGVNQAVSKDRLRGLRIFDISDIRNPRNVGNVQTCRGSHTHTVLVDPKDPDNVYVYISGSAPVRPADELAGCSGAAPGEDRNTALFRIEVIKVPLANPGAAAIVASPRIFEGLVEAPVHGPTPSEQAQIDSLRRAGHFIAMVGGDPLMLPPPFVAAQLDSLVRLRGGTGAPTGADSTKLRDDLQILINRLLGMPEGGHDHGPKPGPNQCHDITVYPAIGLAGGACEGYGLLLDIRNPANPVRIDAVADSNFSYWHSATFNNDGTRVLFSDEWGGGGGPKCRASDPLAWGANAIFSLDKGKMRFRSYYKMPAAQTEVENCVAHNGSLIPIPGRDVMVQAWYQGGLSVFDWTEADRPVEIAFFDRGPVNANEMAMGGSWSAYWYNGVIVSSEIERGLDILELTPNALLTRNEIEAAKTVVLDHLNPQGQPRFVWPPSYALAGAWLDQLERNSGLGASQIAGARTGLASAEQAGGAAQQALLQGVAAELRRALGGARDKARVQSLLDTVNQLASQGR